MNPPDSKQFSACFVDLLEEKKSAPAFLQRRADAVHVYGVDLMSSANLLEYFTGTSLCERTVTCLHHHSSQNLLKGHTELVRAVPAGADGCACLARKEHAVKRGQPKIRIFSQ